MVHKKLAAWLILIALITTTQAYNTSKTYYLNESAGSIYDETVDTTNHNPLLTTTTTEIVLLIIILLCVVIPVCLLLIGIITALQWLWRGKKK